ncbi:TCDD-inducible poly [ADP-ribose] polymerase [Seminavis robusta]|uniref:Poly [ADP-ribose] polymerase n=1 Tax=Seminavis robusta TaxID=568900 RepID=A0A9N8DQM9_9STRA|nr:TCDD-inducible poly [ADP-ribose] polymerase [Seminavis robusta]|eukprot:Sro214_g088730.1 TCDD-inducible poly [ADP-ribose] polymerase (929) ;mRNA; r:34299-37520
MKLLTGFLVMSLVVGSTSQGLYFDNEDQTVIKLAGLFDTSNYVWGPDVFAVTVQLINQGWWDVLNPGDRLEYDLRNTACDETTAVRSYWGLRSANGNKPMHGIIGARCSGASISLARVAGLEAVPQLSPASTSSLLSNKYEFPSFSRMVAPNNERGEVGALIAMMRVFGWERIGILATDTQYAKDLVNDLRSSWVGDHDDWLGQVAFSDVIRLTQDGLVDGDSVLQVLENIPTDPSITSRVIFLAAHQEHAFAILKEANILLNPETIFVGPSSWAPRDDVNNHGWLPRTPGYLGLAPFRNRDQVYEDFMNELQKYQRENGKEILDELPTFAAETVDAIRAMAYAIVMSDDRSDGDAVVRILRELVFDGVSGKVAFTAEGDRKDPKYSLFNVQHDGSKFVWKDIGVAGTNFSSANLDKGFQDVCFAGMGCGLALPPDDTYPPLPYEMPIWAIFLILFLIAVLVALLFMTAKYYRSRRSKRNIKAELNALRDSVVGMRTATCQFVPKVVRKGGDVEQGMGGTVSAAPIQTPKWMWQETSYAMSQHAPDTIYDANDCWILYAGKCSKKIEAAYTKGSKDYSPLPGYVIDFASMEQIKNSTGYKRRVQRVLEADGGTSKAIDLHAIEFGEEFPAELHGEPRMILCEGDIIQISKQREDDFAFGRKLHQTDEAMARQLVAVALNGASSDDDIITTDSGWFMMSKTKICSSDDLAPLQQTVGDSSALDAPSHWDKTSDPSVVQKHQLLPGDHERMEVEAAFLSTLSPGTKIERVERVQHLAMWQSYAIKRQTICNRATCEPKRALERFERKWLFHGTNKEVMDKILQQGFNRSFCGKNATLYGKGVYFARDASYSAQKTYAVPDRQGKQYMMACRVVVGEYCYGKTNVLTPDVRDRKTMQLYDSTVDSTLDPSIHVIFHDAQAYPEYLISFKSP